MQHTDRWQKQMHIKLLLLSLNLFTLNKPHNVPICSTIFSIFCMLLLYFCSIYIQLYQYPDCNISFNSCRYLWHKKIFTQLKLFRWCHFVKLLNVSIWVSFLNLQWKHLFSFTTILLNFKSHFLEPLMNHTQNSFLRAFSFITHSPVHCR